MIDYRRRFYPKGARDPISKEPIPSDRLGSDYTGKDERIWWPCLGIITKVYFSNEPGNSSKLIKALYDQEYSGEITDSESLRATLLTGQQKGTRLECNVKIIKGLGTDKPFLEGVPFAQSFGGIDNYGIVTPRDISNTSDISKMYKSDGDFCIVHFIGGDYTEPFISNHYPHPFNTLDAPAMEDGRLSLFRLNGNEIFVDKDGNIVIDATGAGNVRTIDPNTGAITTVAPGRTVEDPETDHPPGVIIVQNNSNIILSAGDEVEQGDLTLQSRTTARLKSRSGNVLVSAGDEVEEGDLTLQSKTTATLKSISGNVLVSAGDEVEEGDLTLQSKTTATLKSIKDGSVEIFTDQDDQFVNIQQNQGSLLEAARRTDRIKITNLDSGQLFKYLEHLQTTLISFSSILQGALDPAVKSAAGKLGGGLAAVSAPTFQEGTIIEGSSRAKIGGDATEGLLSIVSGLEEFE